MPRNGEMTQWMLVHSHADSYVPIKDSISKQVEKMLCPDVKWEKKKKKKQKNPEITQFDSKISSR